MRHSYLSLLAWGVLACAARAGSIEFVVAELPASRVHHDSYVISIDESDTSRLNHARALAEWVAAGANPRESPGATIVVANVVPAPDGINRDVLAPGEPAWSWHTTQPVNFADFTAEILDGWPTFVEGDVNGWMANTNGAVGFWGYTVVEEIANVPEPICSAWFLVGTLSWLGSRARQRRR